MPSLFIAIGSWVLLILAIEGIIWNLFKYKFLQICPPSETMPAFFHFFTVWRLWFMAVTHTAFLIVVVIIAYLFLWQ